MSRKFERIACFPAFVLFVFGLFTCVLPLEAFQESESGILTGCVYFEDGTTPVPKAIVKIKKVDSELVFESGPTDRKGIFRFESIPAGLYIAGIVYKDENFNVENAIGIRSAETVDVSLIIGKKRPNPILAFFLSPAGLATVAAATVGVSMAVITASGPTRDPEMSAYK
jgi:hypothetical protein